MGVYLVWIEAEFNWEGLLCKKKSVRPPVRTLLGGKWTQLRKNAQKSPIFGVFNILPYILPTKNFKRR